MYAHKAQSLKLTDAGKCRVHVFYLYVNVNSYDAAKKCWATFIFDRGGRRQILKLFNMKPFSYFEI